MSNIFEGKDILITGGAGTIGSAIVRKVLEHKPRVVRVLDNNEAAIFELEQELEAEAFRPLIGDIRDKDRLKRAVHNIDIIFHVAALKHVPLCEYNPFEAVKTNIVGTQNLIEVAIDENVAKLITISTDKAVDPVNVMGATKLLSERLTISANSYRGWQRTIFSCVRFGNVLDSRGSVVPVFKEQIRKGGPVTITDANMTRFVMSITRAAELVLKAAEMSRGGEIFIFKMSALSISDLAEVMIEELAGQYGENYKDIDIKMVGKRGGEKEHEWLLTEDEAASVYEIDDLFVVSPQGITNQDARKVQLKGYDSSQQKLLTKEEIRKMVGADFQ